MTEPSWSLGGTGGGMAISVAVQNRWRYWRGYHRAMWRRHALTVVGSMLLAACGGESTPSASQMASASSFASPSAPVSVVCDVFTDGTWDTLRDVIIGNIKNLDPSQYENLAGPLRKAITGLQDLAERAAGEERRDLEGLAGRLDEIALSAEYERVIDFTDPFYVKYAPGCGLELVT